MGTARLQLGALLPGHEARQDACTDALQSALRALDGVLSVRFVLGGGAHFEVRYDTASLNAEELETRARQAGLQTSDRYVHEDFRLEGLHCADCAEKIATVTGRLDGVLSSNASYASSLLHVAFDSTVVDEARVRSEVESLGYKVKQSSASADGGDTPKKRGHPLLLQGVPGDLLLSFLAGGALLVGFIAQRLGAPTPAWLAAYLIAYVSGGWHATNHAVRAARRRHFDIDILMVTAAVGAAAIGAFAEGALLLFLFSLGHALEHLAMDRARSAIRGLADLTPKTARVRRGAIEEELPVAELRVGDTVIVRPGERIPADGEVIEGTSTVDQAPITGESMPVLKGIGSEAFAGTINGPGALEIRTTKGPEDSTLARVVKVVESAQAAKAPSHRFTDRFQRVLTPVILIVTLLVIIVPPLFGVEFKVSFMRAMTLLVASSPCALALATPSAVLSGIARAARSGVLIKGGAYLESAGTAQVVIFDKTGTLTVGRPSVTDVISFEGSSEENVLSLAASVESRSAHPLATAVLGAAEEHAVSLLPVDAFNETVGHGASGQVGAQRVTVGNRRMMSEVGAPITSTVEERASALEAHGKTVMFLATSNDDAGEAARVVGLLAARDEPRPEAKETIRELKRLGIKKVVMLSGDNRLVAEALASELGIDEVRAELLPEEKVAALEALREEHGAVIMVGDGINDAPALAVADVGVAMGGAGSDVALETADVALMADDLSKLPYAVALSRASRRMIVQNLIISLGVIALLVPSSLLGLATIGVAVVIHESSTLFVVGNALRLLGFRMPAGRSSQQETLLNATM